jgi:hypothetical protein
MMPAVAILSAIFVALLLGFIVFYRWSRTPAFRESELRWATVRFLMVIGPFFGVHIKPPQPEPPAVLTPGPEAPEEGPGGVADPAGRTSRSP